LSGIVFDVLDWNQPAIDFYKKLNATFCDDWKVVCLEGSALQALAKEKHFPEASHSQELPRKIVLRTRSLFAGKSEYRSLNLGNGSYGRHLTSGKIRIKKREMAS
jgi:hypothetical protein